MGHLMALTGLTGVRFNAPYALWDKML